MDAQNLTFRTGEAVADLGFLEKGFKCINRKCSKLQIFSR